MLLYEQNDILVALDTGHSTVLLLDLSSAFDTIDHDILIDLSSAFDTIDHDILIDLSSAFDTIDHDILIHHLQYWFSISSSALNLLSSFLSDHFQNFIASNSKSQPVLLEYGIP